MCDKVRLCNKDGPPWTSVFLNGSCQHFDAVSPKTLRDQGVGSSLSAESIHLLL